jgi:regulator of replication initiation timing
MKDFELQIDSLMTENNGLNAEVEALHSRLLEKDAEL